MKKFIHHNSLSIVFLLLFVVTIIGQTVCGFKEYNKELSELGAVQISMAHYFASGHFIEAVFENWESEFLQMGMFVWFTIFLRQRGSSESKGCEGKEEVDREPDPKRKGAPWPVRKGGVWLAVYKHSLTISLLVLFVISFCLHAYGSFKDSNLHNVLEHKQQELWTDYLFSSRLWFESFQN